jgi:hypothetical protein
MSFLEARIAALKRPPANYVDRTESGKVRRALCKVCEEPITATVAAGTVDVYIALPAYKEVLIEMNDGSHHATLLCVSCAERDDLDLEWIYVSDLVQWGIEGILHETFLHRHPTKIAR